MPGQLLHLRLLLSPSAVTLRRAIAFSPRGLVRTSRGLSRTCRAFSARPEPSARAADRLRRGSAGGQARSLVDDEADLSDWVGDLKMDSFQPGRGGDLDRRSGVGGRSGWRAPVDGQRRGRDSGDDFGSMFDRRKGPSGDMRGRGRGRGRGRRSFLGSNLNDTDEADDDDDDEVRGYGGGRNRGRGMIGVRSRGGREREWRGGGVSRRGGGGGRRGGFEGGYRSREVRREEKPLDMGRRSGHDRKKVSFVSEDEEGEEDGGFGFASIMEKREKRKSEAGWHNGNRGAKRSNFSMSEEEEDDDDDFELASPLAKTNGRLEPRDRMRMSRKPMDDDDFGFTLPQTKGGVGRLGEVEAPGSFKDDVDEDDDEYDEKLDTDGGLLLEGEEEGEGGEMVEATEVEPAVRSHSKAKLEEVDSYLSNSRFDECQLSPLSLKGVKAAGYERMTMVQEATLPIILKGKDVLAKAKTGTGKTVAFLLPAIEILVKQPPVDRDQQKPPIYVLVICPTRELANQAAMEAEKLLKFHPYVGAQCVTGGIRLALEQKRMQANPCQILVATPGRLRDHIENTAGFATRLKGVKVLVLDEADHLLDMGFRKDIEKIIASVPSQRQTLLFSATVPTEVRQVCHIALRRDHEYINTVEEGGEETHAQVKQAVMIAPLDKQFPLLYHLLKNHVADDVDYKVLIFCVTAMVTRLVAELLTEMKLNVREIHSRKSQAYRTRVSDEFRKSKGLILVTSDVSARGVDYPDVTLVIQLGLPADREQYIHRLGRTGRKGKEGQGILLLAPWEEYFLSSIKDLPISKLPSPSVDQDTTAKVKHALDYVEMKDKESAYQAWLGYYKSNKAIARDTSRLVELANEFSRSMGLDTPPAISKLVLGKMGLRNVPGLRSK